MHVGLGLNLGLGLGAGGVPGFGVSAVSPSQIETGYTLDLTVTGRKFEDGADVAFSGTGITVNSVAFVSATELTVNVTLAIGATAGPRTVTVTNPDLEEASKTAAVTVYEYAHRVVNALDTPLRRTGNLGLGNCGYFTGAVRFRVPNTTGTKDIIHLNDGGGNLTGWLRLSGANLVATFLNPSFTEGFVNKTLAASLSADTWYTVHFACSKDGSGTIKSWVNGSANSDQAWDAPDGNIAFPAVNHWTLLGGADTSSPLNRFTGDIAFLYFRAGTTSAAYMTDPSVFYDAGGDVPLDSLAATATILMGGRQSADALGDDTTKGWNSGHNQGQGGDFAFFHGSGAVGYFRDPIPVVDGTILNFMPFDKRDMLTVATGVRVIANGAARTLEKSAWESSRPEDPWTWTGDPAVPYTLSGNYLGDPAGSGDWSTQYVELRMYGHDNEGAGFISRLMDYEHKSYISVDVVRETGSGKVGMLHDSGTQVGVNHTHEWECGFQQFDGAPYGDNDLDFKNVGNLPNVAVAHRWPAIGNGLRDTTVGTVHKFMIIWNHETRRFTRMYQKNDEPPLINVSDEVTVNPATAAGAFLHGFSFGGQRYGDCFLELDSPPADWQDGALWMFEHWVAGDKRLYPRWT